MKDDFGRNIDYLRISLTDRCNFRCKYCMPAEGIEMMSHSNILTLEEIVRLAEISVSLGVSKIRLTGGEPLVRRGVVGLLSKLSKIDGIENISMTSNGFLLEEMAQDLKENGLNRLNISLDTIDRKKFKNITRIDGLDKVLKGIDVAISAGFDPIKINAVAVRGVNDDEIINLAEYSIEKKLVLRFIEQMPFNMDHSHSYMPASEIIEILSTRFGPASLAEDKRRLVSAGSGPAALYHFGENAFVVGFITPISNHFCGNCNRLRITADGKLKPCLLSNEEIDIKNKLREGASDEVIKEILASSIGLKPEKHSIDKGKLHNNRGMSKIGG